MKRERRVRGIDFEIVPTPAEFWELGRRRTAAMLTWQRDRLTLHDLIANAYLQGVQDGYEAHERKGAQHV